MKLKDDNLVVKSNKIIEARYKLSVNGQRIILSLISLIKPEDTDFKRYSLRITDLYCLLKINTKQKEEKQRRLENVTEGLQKNILRIYEGNKLIKPAWIETPEFDWDNDLVTFRISEKLKPYLLQLKKHFTSYKIEEVIQFRKEHSFRFFEICNQHEPSKKYYDEIMDGRYVKRKRYSIPELKEVLGMSKSSYDKRIYDFQRKVILPAQKEVNEKTSVSFDFQMIKSGKTIVFIDLFITSKKPSGQVQKLPEPSESEQLEEQDVFKRLKKIGVSDSAAKQTLEKYGQEKLEIATEALEAEENRVGLRYPNKALETALKEGWTSKKRRRINAREEEIKKEKEKREEIEAHQNLEKQLKDKKAKEENAKFAVLSDEAKFDLIVSKHGYTGRLKDLTKENAEIFKKAVYENIFSKYPDSVYRALAYFPQELRKVEELQEAEKQRAIEKRKLEESQAKQKDKETEQREKDDYAALETDEEKLERLLKDIDPSIYQGLDRANQELLKKTACENIISEYKTLPGARAQMKVLAQKFYERQQPENKPSQDKPATQKPAKTTEFHQLGDILQGINKT